MITEAEYAAMLARTCSQMPARTVSSVDYESDLHEAILEYCKAKGWIAFHGSMAHRTFRTLGEPDFVILLDGGKALLVEAKRPDGKLSTEQLGLHAWAAKLGWKVHTIHSMEEFAQAVKEASA